MSIYSTAVKQFIWVREDNIIGLKLKVFSFFAINIGQELSQILSGVFGRSGSEVIRAFSGALAVKGLRTERRYFTAKEQNYSGITVV